MGLKLIGAALASTALVSVAMAEEVRVYNWSDYIDEELLTKFEEETGLELVYDVFDSNELLETKLLAGGSGYDVVVPSGSFLQRQIEAGAFQKLDKSKLPNLSNMWDVISAQTAKYDPNNEYSVNYMWLTTGIGVNVDKVREALGDDAPVDSLALIFEPENMEKLAECGVHFLDSPTDVIPAALKYIGEDPDAQDADTIAKVEPLLTAIKPYVLKFHSSEYINALANGDICVAFGWAGDIIQAAARADEAGNGVNVEYHIPKEGALLTFDQLAIPTDAPNPDGAHVFINFMMDAQNAAAASNAVYYANGNKASQEFLNEDVIGDTAIYPDEATAANLYATRPWDARVNRTVNRLWTKIKSGT